MSKPSRETYIKNNNFYGALARFYTTTANWKKAWFETCETIYKASKEILGSYVFDPIALTIKEAVWCVGPRPSKYSGNVVKEEGLDLLDNATQKCYLFSFYDAENNLVCSKVGTTTRKVFTRLKEELASSTYADLGCVKAIIHRVYDCGEMPAEGLESCFRAEYIKKYPNSFKKNDRFISTFFDLAEADKIASKYLGDFAKIPLTAIA